MEKDTIIRVDRSIRPPYPSWVAHVYYKEQEKIGPDEYDISTVDNIDFNRLVSSFFTIQTVGVSGFSSSRLESSDLDCHFKLADLLAIQTKGVDFFWKHFAGYFVYAFGTLVSTRRHARGGGGRMHTPYLHYNHSNGEVSIDWAITLIKRVYFPKLIHSAFFHKNPEVTVDYDALELTEQKEKKEWELLEKIRYINVMTANAIRKLEIHCEERISSEICTLDRRTADARTKELRAELRLKISQIQLEAADKLEELRKKLENLESISQE